MDLFFRNYRKSIGGILLAAILYSTLALPFFTLLHPREARASVPIHCTLILDFNCDKELFLDTAARFLAKQILRMLTDSLVQWIKTGGVRGGPLFVENFTDFFRTEIDNAAGLFLEAYLDPEVFNLICSPFRIQLGQLLTTALTRSSLANRATCTLTDVVSNLQNFNVQFTQGGWPAWEALSEPQNNWLGSYFSQLENAAELLSDADRAAETELNTTGGGLLAFKQCDTTSGGNLTNCRVITPGKAVEDAMEQIFEIDITDLNLADELDEVLTAALNALVSWLITGGGGFANYSSGSTPPPAPPADTSAPSSSITAPANNSTVSGTVTLTATASDNIAVVEVEFFVDGVSIGRVLTPPYSISWDSTTVPNGSHSITAIARDATGNSSTASVINVTVSNP